MNDADPPMDEEIQKLTESIDGETNPTRKAKLYLYRGASYAKKKDDDSAIADFDSAIELKPEDPTAYLMRGISYSGSGKTDRALADFDNAIENFTQAIKLKPEDPYAYLGRGRAYLRKKGYDKAIADFTQAIKLEPKNPNAYLGRGRAYFGKEDYDKAIADLTQAIKLKSKDLDLRWWRGRAYLGKEDYDNAIADFTQAIKLKSKDLDLRWWRGRAYLGKEDYDNAIADFTQAIKLKSKDLDLRWWRGRAYLGKEDYDNAIADFTQAIKLEPEDPYAYLVRGRAYLRKKGYDKAFEDFLSAGKQDSTIKLTTPLAYLASRIDDIFNQDQDAQHQKIEAFELYGELLDTITLIQEALFQPPETSQCEEVTHYTSLHALKKLAGKKSFRFYNVTYMNDPDEGRKFFKIMEDNEANVEEFFYEKNDQPYLSPAYIGSFTMVTPKESQKDDLFLWRTYGKHDDKEAAGACLLFKHDGSCFARRFKHQLGPIPQSLLDNESTSEPRPQAKPSLYKISYPDDKNDENDETLENLKDLAEQINLINDFNNKKQHEKKKEQLDELARNFLDTIRFLFKSDHYKAEKEARIVEFHAYKEDEAQSSDNNIKVDVKQIPPRFYVEAPEDFCFSEVILGPRVRSSRDWKQWIEYERKNSEVSEVKVQKSIIKYGSPYS